MSSELKQCDTCRHGPNPDGRLFPSAGHSGCKRMLKIDNVFSNLSTELKNAAEALSTGIIIFLQGMWRQEGTTASDCPGWQQ